MIKKKSYSGFGRAMSLVNKISKTTPGNFRLYVWKILIIKQSMETLDFKLNINLLKTIIMESSFYILIAVCLLLVVIMFFTLPQLLKSEKNILLKFRSKFFGEFEYHQKDN